MSLELDVALPRRDFELRVRCSVGNGITGVLGPSGSGKSSLFRLISGLERPSHGRILLGERVFVDTERGIFLPPARRALGFVFQDRLLFPHLTVKENLLFAERYAPRQSVDFETVVELLDLRRLLSVRPREISGGEAQRTAIGRALLAGPELLLLDEPLSAVDGRHRLSILPYLRALRDQLGIPMLVISHDLPDIQRLTDQILVIEEGRITGQGSAIELLARGTGSSYLAGQRFVNVLNLERPEPLSEGAVAYHLVGASELRVVLAEERGIRATVILPPNEIALGTTPLDGLSIQNQLPGMLRRMRAEGGRVTCQVDIGTTLIAEITASAAARLNLSVGKKVWCFFKASAPEP